MSSLSHAGGDRVQKKSSPPQQQQQEDDDEAMVSSSSSSSSLVEVSVIIPVHNAASTIVEAVRSAMNQVIIPACDGDNNNTTTTSNSSNDDQKSAQKSAQPPPPPPPPPARGEPLLVIPSLTDDDYDDSDDDAGDDYSACYRYYRLEVFVCCYDDGSTDESWSLLQKLQEEYDDKSEEPSSYYYAHDRNSRVNSKQIPIPTRLLIAQAENGISSRGAGYARNRAVEMRKSCATMSVADYNFLCLLDSDDWMHPTRIVEQCRYLLSMLSSSSSADDSSQRIQKMERTLLGCTFDRDPPDATWHYASWANNLSDERLLLERYREITLLQPTWMMSRSWFQQALGGYIEAPTPAPSDSSTTPSDLQEFISDLQAKDENDDDTAITTTPRLRLIHPTFETLSTLRVAEDLRLFHAHLHAGGHLRLLRTMTTSTSAAASSSTTTKDGDNDNQQQKEQKQQQQALVTYRHANGAGQSSQTPRRLLLHLRVLAFEANVLRKHPLWQPPSPPPPLQEVQAESDPLPCFCVWGAGRDGKDFVKALSPDMRRRVACMVDVDAQKILQQRYYVNRDLNVRLPIVHFSLLCHDAVVRQELYDDFLRQCNGDNKSDDDTGSEKAQAAFGRINKGRIAQERIQNNNPPTMTRDEPVDEDAPASRRNKKRRTRNNKNNNAITHHQHLLPQLDQQLGERLPSLPVVVCVAMYRTGGALERNVSMIGRTEGQDLWHLC